MATRLCSHNPSYSNFQIMPARRSPRRSSSEESSSNVSSTMLPTRGSLGRSREHAPSSSDSEIEDDGQQPVVVPVFQSVMAAHIPNNIAAVLDSMRRNMELNFRALHEAIQTHRAGTDKRFDEQRTETNRRFGEQRTETEELFTALRTRTDQYNANRGATHIHSRIYPVGRFNGATEHTSVLDGFPTRVHQFLRLKNRKRWKVLVDLLRSYDIQSWPTWGLYSVWSDDESDEEELLAPKHRTLEEAVEFAPEIALQELAAVIGLDYDKIVLNREEDERLQQNRAALGKRGLSETPGAAKRGKTGRALGQEQSATQLAQQLSTGKPKPDSRSSSDGAFIGWDTRESHDRTPSSRRPRFKDAPRHGQRALSPPSVATSPGDHSSTREKP